jgi:hypothetical protein
VGGLLSSEESIQNPETAPPPEPETDPETAPPVASGPEIPDVSPDTPPDTPPAARPRRRALRTTGLIAVAALLGLVGGTAVGYRIQADREPTPLPPLNQPGLAYPAKPLPDGEEPDPLPASEDLQAKAQGDLRKLLVPRPAGARADGEDGWESLSAYASDYNYPSYALEFQLEQGLRRVATRSWRTGEYRRVTVKLLQYRPSAGIGAWEHLRARQTAEMDEDRADSLGEPVPGAADGRYFLYPVERKAGYMDLHQARAYIQHGDIAVEIYISDTSKIAENDIRSLAERQLGRL